MKFAILKLLILVRLLTNDGIMLENRRHIPKRQPPEVIRFMRRPARRGSKKYLHPATTSVTPGFLFDF